jgi:hypothetical protein
MNLLQVALVLALLAPQEGDAARVQALIDRVRSDRIEERHAAGEELRKIGKEALPALEAAIKGTTDPEVALRLQGIVNALAVPAAAESLKRIEQLLTGAGAVRIAFHQETRTLGKDLDVRQGSTGTLLFAKGNKARLELAPLKGKELLMISNGESLGDGELYRRGDARPGARNLGSGAGRRGGGDGDADLHVADTTAASRVEGSIVLRSEDLQASETDDDAPSSESDDHVRGSLR